MINKSSDAYFEKSEFDKKKLGITLSVLSFIISSIIIFYILEIHLSDSSFGRRGRWLIPSANYKYYFFGVTAMFLYAELFFFKGLGLGGLIKATPILMFVVASALMISIVPREFIFRVPVISSVPGDMFLSAYQHKTFLLANRKELDQWWNENDDLRAECRFISEEKCESLVDERLEKNISKKFTDAKSLAIIGMNIFMASIAFIIMRIFHGFIASSKARDSKFSVIRMCAFYGKSSDDAVS